MVRKQHKVLCIVLCLMLAVSAVCAGTLGAFAAAGDTVYVKANNGWTTLYCYMWKGSGGEGNQNAAWPGVQMTSVGDSVYSYTLQDDYTSIIFNNGSGNQTGDMTYPGNSQIYDLNANSWSTYSGGGQTTTAATTKATTATTVTTPSGSGTTVYLKNSAGWSTVNCYMWNSESDNNSSWPGVKMTALGDDVWMYTASKTFAKCIFNDGGTQTDDLTAQDGYIFDNSTNTWSVYDTSAIRVTAYTADPQTEIYTGTEVTLSAAATSADGNVSYKFSVKNANGGTSIISNYGSADSVTWTPTAVGTYEIIFDFKDTAGNENSRSLSLTVESDASVTKPIIKSVAPGNLNMIKVGASATVSVTAAGGNTGTKLLFYKYVVTDPNGVKNTPYYTLNKTYSFTPSMKGNYTVEVFVQASDNSTVSKTYTYNAIEGDIPITTTKATQGTTATNPTQATTKATQATTKATQATTKASFILGDVNHDGKLNIKDATYIQKFLAEYAECMDVTLQYGDVNGDGKITIKDATQIQRLIAK